MRRILKFYLFITAVMAMNLGIIFGTLVLLSPNSKRSTGGVGISVGDGSMTRNLSFLSDQLHDGYHANLRLIIERCGTPDGYAGNLNGDLDLIYLYDRFGKSDWVAYVTFKSGFLTGIAYNDSSVNDHSHFADWDFSEADIPIYR